MKHRKYLAYAAVALSLAAALAWAFAPRPVEVETARTRVGLFEQAVEEDGRTRLKDRYTVSAPLAARLTRITLRAGDIVTQGDVVAELLPVMSPLVDGRSMQQAVARLGAADAALTRAKAQTAQATVALDESLLDLKRTEQLAAVGFVSPSRMDTARLAATAGRRALDAALAAQEAAVHEQDFARAALAPSEPGRAGRPIVLRAPVAGRILRVAQPSEVTLAAGTPLLEIGDATQLEVVSELLTADAVQAREGARVIIDRWGGPPLEGRIRQVEPAAFTKVSALGIEEQRANAVIEVQNAGDAWRAVGDGFRVNVRIVTASASGALMVPVGAVFPHAGGMAVYVVEGRRAHVQAIDVQARNGSDAWLRGGLAEGQEVVLYPAAEVRDGTRVRTRVP
ncbi:efflux RND transporter periplasmic adaptor subunit [Polaromonas sp. LjRoot131]|uniref:efflux RND transporter periplasmic adaptor subunit n=1 Tax=Polaromonas sp. LjRoot131 TaxID=3342262 RepID=UPI003ECCA476